MTTEALKIISDQANSFIAKIKGNLVSSGTTTTGKSASSLRYQITETGDKVILEVFGKPYFSVVETGRRPTPSKGPSREMITNITEWVEAKGVKANPWAIAWKINNEGSLLWKKGGRTDIYTDELQGFEDKIFIALSENITTEYFRNVQTSFTA